MTFRDCIFYTMGLGESTFQNIIQSKKENFYNSQIVVNHWVWRDRMELTDLASKEQWEELEKQIHNRSGMNSCVYNNQGNRITSYMEFANEVCPAIKSYPEGIAAICATVNQYFGATLAKTKQPLIDECDAGFVKFAVPILYKGAFLGTVGGCGHLFPDGEVETFFIEKAIGKDDLALGEKINTVKKVTEKEVNELIDFVQKYLDDLLFKKPDKG